MAMAAPQQGGTPGQRIYSLFCNKCGKTAAKRICNCKIDENPRCTECYEEMFISVSTFYLYNI